MTDLTNPLLHMQIGVCTSDGSKVCRVGIMRVLKRGATYADSLRECPLGSHGVCRNCEGERAVVNELMVQMCTDFGITMGELFEQLDAAAEEDAVGGGAAAHVAAEPAHFGGGDAVGGGAAVGRGAAVHTAEEIFIMQLRDMETFHDSIPLDETRQLELKKSVSNGVYESWVLYMYTKNLAVLRKLLKSTIPLLQTDMELWQKNIQLLLFTSPLRNLLTRYCSFEYEVKECSALLLEKLQKSTEFDRSFEGPQQKQEMVELMQEFCKRL